MKIEAGLEMALFLCLKAIRARLRLFSYFLIHTSFLIGRVDIYFMDKAKRVYTRVKPNAPALVLADPGTPEERIYIIRVENLSAAGAFFRTNVNLSCGTPTKILFRLKYGSKQKIMRMEFSGKVIRSEPEGFAVAFENAKSLKETGEG